MIKEALCWVVCWCHTTAILSLLPINYKLCSEPLYCVDLYDLKFFTYHRKSHSTSSVCFLTSLSSPSYILSFSVFPFLNLSSSLFSTVIARAHFTPLIFFRLSSPLCNNTLLDIILKCFLSILPHIWEEAADSLETLLLAKNRPQLLQKQANLIQNQKNDIKLL